MNDLTKGKIRIFGALLLCVVAVHLIVLRLIVPAKETSEKKQPEVKQEVPPPPPPKPVYRFRQPGGNPGLGQPFDFEGCLTKLPAGLARQDTCRSGIIIDLATRKVLWAKRPHDAVPVASMVKMMTLLLTMEELERDHKLSLQSKVDISPTVTKVPRTGVIWLDPKETFPLEELLLAISVKSANDAAVALAYEIGGSIEGFAKLMNEKAKSLGLIDTHFANPHGLDDDEHYTTAFELAKITAEALKYPEFREIASSTSKRVVKEDITRLFVNHNKLLSRYEGCIGVKTGYTQRSGRCLVSAAERDGVELIAVTLSCPDDWLEHEKMLDFGLSTKKCLISASIPLSA